MRRTAQPPVISRWSRRVRRRRGRRSALFLTGLLLAGAVTGCEDDPFQREWIANVGTAELFSLARPELNLPSGFDFNDRRTIEIERVLREAEWDIVLDTREGELVFLPPRVLNVDSRAAVAAFPGSSFDDVSEAPDSAGFVFDEPVPVELNTVYVIQTGERIVFGFPCLFYAKLEPFEVDAEEQTVSFMFDVNPFCDDRNLIPDSG